jgi:peptide/nickel transport system ATP-binding protein/oligopeptide transport system ATP-binding protein
VSTAPSALLEIRNLSVHYPGRANWFFQSAEPKRAVDGISFTIPKGKTVGLVGESGSGKSTTGKAIIKLAPLTSGQILYQDPDIYEEMMDIGGLTNQAFNPWRKKIQMIFQDPYNSLNPRADILGILSEPLEIHFPKLSKADRKHRCAELLAGVQLSPDFLTRYPHEFSGGQRQRIGIARALAVQPELIICDEPVSALDVSVQAEVVNLLQDLQEKLGLTYLFIAHDLAVVEHVSDHILVMSKGQIVEQGVPSEILGNPQHAYTKTLLAAVPRF